MASRACKEWSSCGMVASICVCVFKFLAGLLPKTMFRIFHLPPLGSKHLHPNGKASEATVHMDGGYRFTAGDTIANSAQEPHLPHNGQRSRILIPLRAYSPHLTHNPLLRIDDADERDRL